MCVVISIAMLAGGYKIGRCLLPARWHLLKACGIPVQAADSCVTECGSHALIWYQLALTKQAAACCCLCIMLLLGSTGPISPSLLDLLLVGHNTVRTALV